MPTIIRTDHAEIDLLEIWVHIAERSVSAANRFVDKLQRQAETIARFPGGGTARDDLSKGLRSWPVGNYVIFFTQTPDGIAIQRVLHGARNIETEFRR